jgi:hypothetical protein
LENFCSSRLGHLQTLLYFPFVLDYRTLLSVDFIYSVYPCPVETSMESILLLWSFYTLFILRPLETKKGEYMFDLDWDCIFNRLSDFCPKMAKGGVC